MRTFAAAHPRDTPDDLWGRYEPYAALAERVLTRVAILQAQVVRDASLEDFAKTLGQSEVTILIAHWRSARFVSEDLVLAEDLPALGELNAEMDGEVQSRLQQEGLSLPTQLAVEQLGWFECRQKMELRFPGRFRGGAGVQFHEGFQTIQCILEAIPPGWNRTLDLGVCQSILLGDEISRRHKDGLVLKATDLTRLDFRLALVHQVMENLHRCPQPYETAMYEIRKELISWSEKKSTSLMRYECSTDRRTWVERVRCDRRPK